MKRNSSNATPTSTQKNPEHEDKNEAANHAMNWDQEDPLWNLLSEATETEPNPFFARNVVRAVRLNESRATPIRTRILRFLTSHKIDSPNRKLALAATACACIMLGYQLWPTPETTTSAPTIAQVPQPSETTTALTELVIEETLLAAADDPTMFTRDEVVTMLGL